MPVCCWCAGGQGGAGEGGQGAAGAGDGAAAARGPRRAPAAGDRGAPHTGSPDLRPDGCANCLRALVMLRLHVGGSAVPAYACTKAHDAYSTTATFSMKVEFPAAGQLRGSAAAAGAPEEPQPARCRGSGRCALSERSNKCHHQPCRAAALALQLGRKPRNPATPWRSAAGTLNFHMLHCLVWAVLRMVEPRPGLHVHFA